MSFTFIDLFAGIGGFHAALKNFGGKAVFVSEIDNAAKMIYESNWIKNDELIISGDIKPLTEGEKVQVPKHNVLTGGFPCQPFSKSGNQRGVNEARGTLFFNILKIIETKKPELVLLENVRNLVGPKHLSDYKKMIRLLRQLGYVVSTEPTIISPHEIPEELGGSPQHRERVFIGAIKMENVDSGMYSNLGPLIKRKPFPEINEWDLKEFLERKLIVNKNVNDTKSLSQSQLQALDAWNEFLKIYRKTNRQNLPGFPLWSEFWQARNKFTIARSTPIWKKAFINSNNIFYMNNKNWIDSWRKEHKFESFIPSYKKFEWQARGEKDIFNCLIQFRPSGIRVKNPNYVPAFVALTQTPILGWEKRSLSIAEAKLLQGFPEYFSFGNQNEKASFKQIGNAVHAGVAGLVFQALLKRAIKINQPWARSIDVANFYLDSVPLADENSLF
jgi:DNA (cytosine-5)-methyltransferase 1